MLKQKVLVSHNSQTQSATYDFELMELQGQNLSILPRKMDIEEFEKLRNSTISTSLVRGHSIQLFEDIGNGFVEIRIPEHLKIAKIGNFRILCNKNGRFEGIQCIDGKGIIHTGGNKIHHKILWDITEEEANNKMSVLVKEYPQYKFKLEKVG